MKNVLQREGVPGVLLGGLGDCDTADAVLAGAVLAHVLAGALLAAAVPVEEDVRGVEVPLLPES